MSSENSKLHRADGVRPMFRVGFVRNGQLCGRKMRQTPGAWCVQYGGWVAAGLACCSLLLTVRQAVAHPELPGRPQEHPIALVQGVIHTMSDGTIDEGSLLFIDGRIVAVGRQINIPDDAERIELAGKHVYPGLFNTAGTLGLVEINAVRATLDITETGDLNPNVRADTAINPDSELIPVTRSNGVLLNLSAPSGDLISGQSAVFQLDGWTREDMTLLAPAAMHVRWPTVSTATRWWDAKAVAEQRKIREEQFARLEQAFEDAVAYGLARQQLPKIPVDLRWEALLPVLRGEVPLLVDADRVDQIQAAVAFAVKRKLRLIVRGGYDAPYCAPLLRENHVPVIVPGTYRLPLRRSDPYDAAYTLPERLRQANVKFCIAGSDRFDASNIRNLPYHAAMAVAFGLPRDEALKAITLYPAQILGLDHQVGSLAAGKDATLFVIDGDPLEAERIVEKAYIQGREVSLVDRHKRLYHKYQEKLRRDPGDTVARPNQSSSAAAD